MKLTPFRLRILELIAKEGLNTTEIALRIKCPRNTIRKNVDMIRLKLKAKRLSQAVYNAMKEGIIK